MKNINNNNNKSVSNVKRIVGNRENRITIIETPPYFRNKSLINNRMRLTIILLLSLILLISVVYAAETTSTAPAADASAQTSASSTIMEFGLGKNFKPDPSLDKQTQENLNNINNYAQNNWGEVKGSYGRVKIENNEITIYNANNEQFAKIPKGYNIIKNEDNFVVTNEDAKSDSVLEIKGNKASNLKKDSTLSFSEKDNIQGLKLDGEGDLEINSKPFKGMKDATFKTNNGQINYADFTSTKGGDYSFQTKDNDPAKSRKFEFNIKENGKIQFDSEGITKVSNGKNTITIENGEISLKREALASDNPAESFSAKYSDNNKQTNVYLDQNADKLYVSSALAGRSTTTALVPLSSYEGVLSAPEVVQQTYIDEMQKNLDQLKSSGASRDKTDALELAIANAQNRNDYTDNSIERIKTYLDGDRTSSSELNAKLTLAELYAKRAANPIIPVGTNLLDWDKTARLQSAADYQASIDMYKSIKQEATTNQLRETAGFSLAETYRNAGDLTNAAKEYNVLVDHGSSKETISNAELGIAQLHLDNNDPRRSLISLDNSLSINPSNIQAMQLKESIINGVYENIQKGLGNQLTEFEKVYEEKLGLGNYQSLTRTPGAALKSAFLNSGTVVWNSMGRTEGGISADFMGRQYEISQAQLGTSVFENIRREGYSDTGFAQLNFNDRKKIVADSYDLTYIDEDKLKQAFIKENEGTIAASPNSGYFDEKGNLDRYNAERDNFITKLYGKETLRQDKLVYDMTTASINAQKNIYDLNLITDPKKLADSSNSDFKFKTGEGYIDPENLKMTWKDTVLEQINLANAASVMAPGATIAIGGETITLAGAAGRLVGALPGSTIAAEGIASTRAGAAEMLGLSSLAEKVPSLAKAGGVVSREAANYQIAGAINQLPGGQYISPFININPSTNGIGTAGEVVNDFESAGVKAILRDVELKPSTGQFIPRFFLSEDDISAFLQQKNKFGITEVGEDIIHELPKGTPRIFETQGGKRFSLVPESSSLSISTTASHMEGVRIPPKLIMESASDNIAAQQEGISAIVGNEIEFQKGLNSNPPVVNNLLRRSPTEVIESIDNPKLEASFYKLAGKEPIDASMGRTSSSVSFKGTDELPGDLGLQVEKDIEEGRGVILGHTHSAGRGSVVASPADISSFIGDPIQKSNIIAVRNKNSGEVSGYVFLRKTDETSAAIDALKNTDPNMDVKGVAYRISNRGSYLLRANFFTGKVKNPEIYFDTLQRLRDEFKIQYRFVPVKGYKLSIDTLDFMKE